MALKSSFVKNYGFTLLLVFSILLGSCLGVILKERAASLKPFGDIFLNLLFTSVVPLVFFSISSAVAGMSDFRRLRRIAAWMIATFIATGIVSSALMIVAVKFTSPAQGVQIEMPMSVEAGQNNVGQQVVKALTASDFSEILSKKNMLALIVFSLLVGLATSAAGGRAKAFGEILLAGNEVMTKVIKYVMFYAPVGLGAYFAYLVGVFGPQLMGSYFRVIAIYYPVSMFYFFVFFSLYAHLAAGVRGIKTFWSNIVPAALTAWATGSSVAAIPTNLEAARNIGIPKDIREVVIPIGATIHMDGSCLSAILKIAFLFGIFHMDFAGPATLATAIGIALLSGTVMAGISGGGFLGELLIVTMYGFPPEALPLISMIGTLLDPPATMVNATGDSVASMLVSRILHGKKWMDKNEHL